MEKSKGEIALHPLLPSFESQCFNINDLSMKKHFFLRVYELRKKFRYLTKKKSKKNEIVRQLSSCVIVKSSGFEIVKKTSHEKLKNEYDPIKIVFFR